MEIIVARRGRSESTRAWETRAALIWEHNMRVIRKENKELAEALPYKDCGDLDILIEYAKNKDWQTCSRNKIIDRMFRKQLFDLVFPRGFPKKGKTETKGDWDEKVCAAIMRYYGELMRSEIYNLQKYGYYGFIE